MRWVVNGILQLNDIESHVLDFKEWIWTSLDSDVVRYSVMTLTVSSKSSPQQVKNV